MLRITRLFKRCALNFYYVIDKINIVERLLNFLISEYNLKYVKLCRWSVLHLNFHSIIMLKSSFLNIKHLDNYLDLFLSNKNFHFFFLHTPSWTSWVGIVSFSFLTHIFSWKMLRRMWFWCYKMPPPSYWVDFPSKIACKLITIRSSSFSLSPLFNGWVAKSHNHVVQSSWLPGVCGFSWAGWFVTVLSWGV